MTRRRLLRWLTRGIGAMVAAAVGVPVVGTVLSPVLRRPRAPRWRAVGALEGFSAGAVSKTAVEAGAGHKGVYVWRREGDEVVVFSRRCTDLGCPVTYEPGSGMFYCPCHGGIFRQDGESVAGPPPRPLYRYATRVRAGVLEIDLSSVPPAA